MREDTRHDTIPEQPETPATATEAAPPRPFFWTLDLRTVGRSRVARALLIGLVLASFMVAPEWRFLWSTHLLAFRDFWAPKAPGGLPAWRWIDGRTIRITPGPGTHPQQVEEIRQGVQAMVDEAGLTGFTVAVAQPSAAVLAAYRSALVMKQVNGRAQSCLSFKRLSTALVALRAGDPHADMLVVEEPIAEAWWAHGMAEFPTGTAILEADMADFHLGKHETCHLLGYMIHDSYPLVVFGYAGEGNPWQRDTLMMINGQNNDLSPRARDALHAFWEGVERKTGEKFLKE
jgi:hypothetical protein